MFADAPESHTFVTPDPSVNLTAPGAALALAFTTKLPAEDAPLVVVTFDVTLLSPPEIVAVVAAAYHANVEIHKI